jgi:D-glycero-alpha-D-manno-heptose-7-phosphate kinase
VNLGLFVISENASLREALTRLDANHHGIILTTDKCGAAVGCVTDGDIRRKLLEGASMEDPIFTCANSNFVYADNNTPREFLLKQLDNRIKVIPLLDSDKKLTGIVSRDSLPVQIEEPVYARARAPVRISFGGGGSDLTDFFSSKNGAVINATISLFSHATLRKRNDLQVIVHSKDLKATLQATDLQHALKKPGPFGLIQAVLRTVHPEFGFEIYLHSDFPMNSGLGGSAVVSAAVLGCFNQFRQDRWDLHEIAELAYQAERLYFGVAGGWQDQYATVFGGFNFMEFRMDQNIIHPLRIPADIQLELEEGLLLCDTGLQHDSGVIHQDQRDQMMQSEILKIMQMNVDLTYKIRNYLLRGELLKFGKALNDAWILKRQFSNKISSERIDQIYENAISNGAVGGKLLGAGGGGFFIFYVTPFRKYDLIAALESLGLNVRPFRFEHEGMSSWSARERKNQMQQDS